MKACNKRAKPASHSHFFIIIFFLSIGGGAIIGYATSWLVLTCPKGISMVCNSRRAALHFPQQTPRVSVDVWCDIVRAFLKRGKRVLRVVRSVVGRRTHEVTQKKKNPNWDILLNSKLIFLTPCETTNIKLHFCTKHCAPGARYPVHSAVKQCYSAAVAMHNYCGAVVYL